ncbi:MAG: hypothetical protein Q8K82_22645 [Gemmatimonadaceae bacterium]|nr:hypothetical protein [Gemmatimonadaceae bacterium]
MPRRPKGGPGALDFGGPYLVTDEPVSLEGYERLAIGRAIAAFDGDKIAAADALKVGKSTLCRRMGVLGMPR